MFHRQAISSHRIRPVKVSHQIDLTCSDARFIFCAMEHSPGFLKIVNEARPHVKEVTVEEARARLAQNPEAILVDVREDAEWQNGHATEAIHLGKGILERDLEKKVPDPKAELIMYCGGGYRSILTADAAQKMGYSNVYSIIGGYKGMVAANWPMS
jgi:rhodanese-related sulfurtransferase